MILNVPLFLSKLQVKELFERMGYLSDDIVSVKYDEQGNVFEILLDEQCVVLDVEKVIAKNYELLIETIKGYKVLPSKVIKNNREGTPNENNSELNLETRDYLLPNEVELLRVLDRGFERLAIQYSATIRDYSCILDEENMNKSKYHLEFPQNILSLFDVSHNFSVLNDIRNYKEFPQTVFRNTKRYLRPCICYSTYNEYSDKTLNSNIIITSMGKCFRNEIDWKIDNLRKKEFYMREIVFLGDKEFVTNLRNDLIEKVWSLFEKLGLYGSMETASDPFFYSEGLKKGTFQKFADAKFELISRTTGGKDVSLASFNYCGDMVCKSYNIKNNLNDYVYSGCVAFGISRWIEIIKQKKDWQIKDIEEAFNYILNMPKGSLVLNE